MAEAVCPVENGCSGLCCAAFSLPERPEKLPEIAGDEGEQIAAMVIPLTAAEARERYEAFGGTDPEQFPADGTLFFTCRNWDEVTRLCAIYETRPDMCRKFPYGNGCPHGCPCKGTPVDDICGGDCG